MAQYSTVSNAGDVIRSNITGEVGCRFHNQTGEDVVITHLGRWVRVGNSQTHTLTIYGAALTSLGSVSVNCSGATTGDFVWGALSSPVTIPKATSAIITSSETSGGDSWHNAYSSGAPGGSQVINCADIGYIESAWRNPISGTLEALGGTAIANGPVSFQYSGPLPSWTKLGTVYTTNGVYYQIVSAMTDADGGDTVSIPAGTYTWGEGSQALTIAKPIMVAGAGMGSTIINMHAEASAGGYTDALIYLGDGAGFRDMTFNGGAATATLFAVMGWSDWRVLNVAFTQQSGRSGYFAYLQYAPRGLIANCTIEGGTGDTELIFARGPSTAWQSAVDFGSENFVFVEDCTFNGQGYVCDANSNGRIVVRNCTINGTHKVDGHGFASNSGPARGVRAVEAYRNTWTSGYASSWPAVELRGGNGRIWGNDSPNASYISAGIIRFDEYGVQALWPNFSNLYQTPTYYPVTDQIGVGTDPKTAAAEPAYAWLNRKNGSRSDVTYNGNPVPTAAITQYRIETSNPAATFTYSDIIQHDRDYFQEVASFNGTSGVGTGTRAQMDAITPSRTGVGFWVTDEGSWDTNEPANTSGRLYVWSGSAWVLDYTPYTYPHPLRGDDETDVTAPTPNPSTIASVTVNSTTQITVIADTATDAVSPPVEYNHSIDGVFAGWQSSATRAFAGLLPGTLYSFRVKARDAALNETTQSGASTATTTASTVVASPSPLGHRGTRAFSFGAF